MAEVTLDDKIALILHEVTKLKTESALLREQVRVLQQEIRMSVDPNRLAAFQQFELVRLEAMNRAHTENGK